MKKPCVVEGCDGSAKSRGWCAMHYQRWQANGDPLASRKGVRVSFAPMWALARPDSALILAEQLGMARRTVVRWKSGGVPLAQADRVAAALGRHPSEIWGPDWDTPRLVIGRIYRRQVA